MNRSQLIAELVKTNSVLQISNHCELCDNITLNKQVNQVSSEVVRQSPVNPISDHGEYSRQMELTDTVNNEANSTTFEGNLNQQLEVSNEIDLYDLDDSDSELIYDSDADPEYNPSQKDDHVVKGLKKFLKLPTIKNPVMKIKTKDRPRPIGLITNRCTNKINKDTVVPYTSTTPTPIIICSRPSVETTHIQKEKGDKKCLPHKGTKI